MPTFQAAETEFVHQCDSCGRDATFLDLIRHHRIWVCHVCYQERTACPGGEITLGGPDSRLFYASDTAEQALARVGVAAETARERKVYGGGPRIEF